MRLFTQSDKLFIGFIIMGLPHQLFIILKMHAVTDIEHRIIKRIMEGFGKRFISNQHTKLGIDIGRARIHIVRADKSVFVIHRKGFGMQTGAVFTAI